MEMITVCPKIFVDNSESQISPIQLFTISISPMLFTIDKTLIATSNFSFIYLWPGPQFPAFIGSLYPTMRATVCSGTLQRS